MRLSSLASGGDGSRQKLALDGAAYLLLKIWRHITTVSFVSAFIVAFTGKHINVYKWVWIGPKPKLLFFLKVCCYNFYTKLVYQASMFGWKPFVPTSLLPTTLTRLLQVNWVIREVWWAPPYLWRTVRYKITIFQNL